MWWGWALSPPLYIYIGFFLWHKEGWFEASLLDNGGVKDPMLVSSSCVYMYTTGIHIYIYIHTYGPKKAIQWPQDMLTRAFICVLKQDNNETRTLKSKRNHQTTTNKNISFFGYGLSQTVSEKTFVFVGAPM